MVINNEVRIVHYWSESTNRITVFWRRKLGAHYEKEVKTKNIILPRIHTIMNYGLIMIARK